MLNATSNENLKKLYALSALFIYSNQQDVTTDKILAILKVLGVEGQKKFASFFEADAIKMKSMLTSVSKSSSVQVSSAVVTDSKVEEKQKEEEPEEVEDVAVDFDDLF